jgi:hypothetical protein
MVDQKKKGLDWERIEADYRAGLLSVREIASAQGVFHAAIGKRAKRDGWERDLGAKIKAKAKALVTSKTVTKEVTAQRVATDRAIIEANAEVIANVRIQHWQDIGRARRWPWACWRSWRFRRRTAGFSESLARCLVVRTQSRGCPTR